MFLSDRSFGTRAPTRVSQNGALRAAYRLLMKRKTMNDKPDQPQPPEQPASSESGALIEPSEEAVGVGGVDGGGPPSDPMGQGGSRGGPADHPAKDHTVGAVLQPGYQMGDALIRPARVIVLQWQGDERPGSGDGK